VYGVWACAGEVKGLKVQCNSLADAAQAEKFELLAAKQENERLQDQIVQVRLLCYLAQLTKKVAACQEGALGSWARAAIAPNFLSYSNYPLHEPQSSVQSCVAVVGNSLPAHFTSCTTSVTQQQLLGVVAQTVQCTQPTWGAPDHTGRSALWTLLKPAQSQGRPGSPWPYLQT
jgi:hypothetical protein